MPGSVKVKNERPGRESDVLRPFLSGRCDGGLRILTRNWDMGDSRCGGQGSEADKEGGELHVE